MKNIKEMSAPDRARYLGTPEQMYSVRRVKLEDGRAKNTTEFEVQTGGGLSYTVLADNGLDIGTLSYRGVNMSYLTKNGSTSPYLAETYENGFSKYFPAGMVYTCGMLSVGGGNRDADQWHTTHGRYHLLPAREVCGEVCGDVISVRGKIRESELFGHCLEVVREVTSEVGGSDLVITDILTNQTPNPTEFMMLYHCNFGYPFLDENLKLILPKGTNTRGRTPLATERIATHSKFGKPIDNDEETVYFHEIPAKDGCKTVRAENVALGIGMEMTFSAETLPILAEWKCMRSGEYVLGLEPTNCYIMGRADERKNGTIQTVAPFASVKMQVKIRFYDL
ncbi:MAG: aldose 1-epimerase family protein [Clostridia bacterium]|nr:aldose 1-epimerase family protein [Clostridia bacterium]